MPKPQIFNESNHDEFSLGRLLSLMASHGVEIIHFKQLGENNNSKNQIYLAGNINELAFLPMKEAVAAPSKSAKSFRPDRNIRYSFDLPMKWLSGSGMLFDAPHANLIYYPQYPEVRLSGFLLGGKFDSDGWFEYENPRSHYNRILVFGVSRNPEPYTIAFLALPDTRIQRELLANKPATDKPLLSQIRVNQNKEFDDDNEFLRMLRMVIRKGWMQSCKITTDGSVQPYLARNGGGYTLEASLGITPNGMSEPDLFGWEIKQFGLTSCESKAAGHALTLMTPEPASGLYKDDFAEFLARYGRYDASLKRTYFTGLYRKGVVHPVSQLALEIDGYDGDHHRITDINGGLVLRDGKNGAVARWPFSRILDHWERKHTKAAYIISTSKTENDTIWYRYCPNVTLFRGTTVLLFLKAVYKGQIYYDPSCKIENNRVKKRNQFRVHYRDLGSLYKADNSVDLSDCL